MAINKELLQETFDIYDNETIVEIINIFFEEHPGRIKALDEATNNKDSELLRTTAHGLKGVISHFHAEEARNLAKKLEDKGTEGNFNGTDEIKEKLYRELDKMMEELEEIKKNYQ
jgi:HPt (histidine-containing phosphotransfer) domain-containing protein